MNVNRLRARLLAAAFCAGMIPVAILGGTAASADESGGRVAYQCQGDRSSSAAPTPVGFALIGPPTSVRPGDTLSLVGTLDITLSQADAQQSKLVLAKKASLAATDFALVVSAGGKTIQAKPAVVTSAPQAIADPWRMVADITFSDIQVPADATGAITVAMPVAKGTETTVVGTPEQVTFNVEVAQDSLLLKVRKFACWTDEPDEDPVVARIPVAGATGTSSGQTDVTAPEAGAPHVEPPSVVGGLPDLPALPGAPTDAVVPPTTAGAPEPAAGGATALAEEATALASVEIPPETATSETLIPGWMLALFIAIVPVAAVAAAVVQRRRLQAVASDPTSST